MDNVMIKNAQGEQLNINVIRYFRLNGIEYLVFTLNEVDEGGYVKLYISKVNGNFANTIADDVEWNLIKDTIKTIIKSNKDNLPLAIIDLDVRKLSSVQVVDQKVFKLSETFLQLLGANKKVEPYVELTQNIVAPEISTQVEPSGIEAINVEPIQLEPVSASFEPTENLIQPNPIESMIQPVQPESVTQQSQPPINDFINPVNVGIPSSVNPTTEMSVSTSDNNAADLGNNDDYGLDYKTLYENELNKTKLLTEENEKYKSMLSNLKNIINQIETF